MRANALVALLAGTLFGAGLAISGMTDPGKVIGFLDLAGQWDPSLAFVMGAAICISLPTFQLLRGRSKPVFASQYFLPTKQDLDPQLILGAVLFGIGWGIAGLCPGPAIANLASASPEILGFVVAMVAGMWLRERMNSSSSKGGAETSIPA
mgnify:CR=1 FL=1|tara:strand:- start:10346 stop:10798 length:453 start_codon:yes stop_codon:yes gene_type:complete